MPRPIRSKPAGPTAEQITAIETLSDAVCALLDLDPEGGQVMIEPGRYICLRAEAARQLVTLARAGKESRG